MKKSYLFLAATAILALASCSENTYLGENEENAKGTSGAISFGNGFKTVTRAEDKVGADAADLLGEKFIVGGFKNGTAENGVAAASGVTTVFDNYIVQWNANTAATTESNTSDWEYVGIKIAAPSSLYTNVSTDPGYDADQTIKYWDFSASQYDFIAYSVGKGNTLVAKTTSDIATGNPTENNVWVTAISASDAKTNAYKLRGAKADLLECYIADLKTVTKTNYKEEVQLDFRRLASKVRIALYETIPGYSVTEVKFYTADDTPIKTDDEQYVAPTTTATLFGTNAFKKNGTYTISFPTIGSSHSSDADYNKAHVTFDPDDTNGTESTESFGSIVYSGKERKEATGTNFLGRTSPAASYAKTAGVDYHYVLPNETGAVVELRVDYTLVPIDGATETIVVRGAKAFVPSTYMKWYSNFAYTYIFKISDNTNGWTSQLTTDPAGLYPITFDAVITEAENYKQQSTITTVAMPSITTYQKGHDLTKDEYTPTSSTTDSIYVQVMKDKDLATDLSTTNSKLYTVTARAGKTITEAEVMDALNIIESESGDVITGRNQWKLTKATIVNADGAGAVGGATFGRIPTEDGKYIHIASGEAARFSAAANTTYAYVYDTGTYGGAYYATEPTGWPTGYYTDPKCENAATGTFAAGTFYQKADTYIYTAVHYAKDEAAPSDWTGNYWNNPDGTGDAVTAFDSSAEGGVTYYRRYTVNHKIYGVKVIKVATT